MPKPRLALRSLIVRLYQEEKMSLHEIADKLGVNRDVVRSRLREAGVDLRDQEEAALLAKLTRPESPLARPCAWQFCGQESGGYDGQALELCYVHAKRALGLLDAGPRRDLDPSRARSGLPSDAASGE